MNKRHREDKEYYSGKKFKYHGGYSETPDQGSYDDASSLPKVASMRLSENQSQTDFRRVLRNKPDWLTRPFHVLPNGHIYVEVFSPMYKNSEDFLVSIAEPVSRQRHSQEYKMTAYSLYAAASMGLSTEQILATLDRFCKTSLPAEVVSFVKECTTSYGKLNVILRNSKYFLESPMADLLADMMKDATIQSCMLGTTESLTQRLELQQMDSLKSEKRAAQSGHGLLDIYKNLVDVDDDDDDNNSGRVGRQTVSFEVAPGKLETLQKRCLDLGYYPLAEYDFRNDVVNLDINITLKPNTTLRPYQEKSLKRMFGSGRARSGVIVLPCGAGKTLTGVAAACTIKKRCLVLCTSSVAVEQWKNQFKLWSSATDEMVCRFTSEAKDRPMNSSICISTYSMITHSTKRSAEAEQVMKWLNSIEWGLMILDEVQFVPAKMFRRVISNVHAHCKLGLTATLVREDDKISDLNFLIGPKLYEANWLELQDKGYIAKVQCCEVACRMDPMFYREYLKSNARQKVILFVMNPNKFRICQFLIEYHEKRNDKIIVFADSLYSLKTYARTFNKPFLCGSTPQQERMTVLENFKKSSVIKTIFVSKIADNSFDLPDANVLIQISSLGGSRRQEAQRLGRILRAKKDSQPDEYNAFFYTLVSQDTGEQYFAHKRQTFLAKQGYSYKFIHKLEGMEKENLVLSTDEERKELLDRLLSADNDELLEEEDGYGQASSKPAIQKKDPSAPTNNFQAGSKPSAPSRSSSQSDRNSLAQPKSVGSSSHGQSSTSDAADALAPTGEQQTGAQRVVNVAQIASAAMSKETDEKKKPAKKVNNGPRHFLFAKFRK